MFTKTKLSNGLRLVMAPLNQTKAVTVLVLIPVGSRYENKKNNGVSHFVEHLLFKGTKKRPTSMDITKELDSVGAEYNAFTSKDHTGYYVKTTSDKVDLAFDILSDMIFNSKFDPAEIDKERGVIVEEINMYNDNPLMNLGSLFENTVFGDHPLGWQISGPKNVIKNIKHSELVNYKNKYYHPKNIIISVSGNINPTKVKNLTKKYFGQSLNVKTKSSFSKIKISQTKPKINLMYKDTKQVQVGLGFPAYSLLDDRVYPLYLLAVILGGNMSSRLFSIVREKNGLAYYIRADMGLYQDTGSFMIQAGLDKKRINQALTLILSELKRARDEGVTDKEISSAKEFLKGKIFLELEDSENVADWFGKQVMFFDKVHTPEQRIKKILAVSAKDISRAAKEVIRENKLNLALIGPFKEKAKFQKLLKL